MCVFLTFVIVFGFCFVASMQLYVNRRRLEGNVGRQEKYAPYVVFLTVLLLLTNMIVGDNPCSRLPFCLMFGLLAFHSIARKELAIVLISEIVCCAYLGICAMGIITIPSSEIFIFSMVGLMLLDTILYIRDIYRYLRVIRNVMRMGSVWNSLCSCVDAVYILILSCITAIYVSIWTMTEDTFASAIVFSILLALYQIALSVRTINSSVFVLWTDHERRIVESMKLTQLEVSGDNPGYDRLYQAIYERILECFENNKPYLDPELSINDIVEKVYSNKLYISKSISHHTGRNFCQFVNYYRILHAVEIFRNNPKLRVVEMATRSGFNSTVSFTSAFRLYMGEKPSDWCRKERAALEKQKKFVAQ